MERLSTEEIEQALGELDGWVRIGDAIVKRYVFRSVPEALAFVVRLSFHAESVDHHPDISFSMRRVTVSLSTHSAGGITRKDLDSAAATDQLARTGAPLD